MIYFHKKNQMQDIDLSIFASFFSYDCELCAVEQIDKAYKFAGGWREIDGFTLKMREDGLYELDHPEDIKHPGFIELARGALREEIVIVFQSSFVAVLQIDSTYSVARVD